MLTGAGLFLPLALFSYVHLMRCGDVDVLSAGACVAFALAMQPFLDWIKSRRRAAAR